MRHARLLTVFPHPVPPPPRRSLSSSFTLQSTEARVNSVPAVAFDVDGVLLRGKEPLPKAKQALELLEKNDIPYILLTNGGGCTERAKAQSLSTILGHPISPSSLALAHSPFRALVDSPSPTAGAGAGTLRNKPVLVVGKRQVHQIAWEYGFENTYDIGDLHHQWPELFPDWAPLPKADEWDQIDPSSSAAGQWLRPQVRDVHEAKLLSEPIASVLMFMDPFHYHRDMQIVADVIRSNGFPGLSSPLTAALATAAATTGATSAASVSGAGAGGRASPLAGVSTSRRSLSSALPLSTNLTSETGERVRVYAGGPDLEYAAGWHAPRFGSGIFAAALGHLLTVTSGGPAVSGGAGGGVTWVGKPHPLTYEYAEGVLAQAVSKGGTRNAKIGRVYMVGDNPKSDIRGARSQGWHSLLVRTGVYQGAIDSNDREDPADDVVEGVMDAVERIIAREEGLVE